MEFYTEWRLLGDEYGGCFGNGMTLSGGESVQGMRVVQYDEDETVFEGKHGHRVKCCHQKRDGVTFCKSVFENPSDKTVRLELLSSVAISGICADRMHRATSFWSAEGKLLSQDLTELNMEPSWAKHGLRIEKYGQVGSMPVRKWFPFLVLEDSERSHFVGIQLYCAASWQIEVMTKDEKVRVQGGLADRDFGQWTKEVAPHDRFETPLAVVAEGDSLPEVCDKLVKAQTPQIAEADRDMPVIFNEYCTTWGNPTLENLRKTAQKLQGSGVKYLVIDSGWYKSETCRDWFSGAGDWLPSKELFPNGIKEAADTIRSYGFIPGLWFEYENCGSHSEVYHTPAHLLTRDGIPVTVGGRRFLDMRDEWVWQFLDERVLKLLQNAGFGYIKVDYNETIGAGVDGAESYGEGLRQTAAQSQAYFRHMREMMPELVIESCASGGHRLEPSWMALASMASFSDAHECTSIPLIAANLQRLIRPEQCQIWAVIRKEADIHRIHYLLTSAFFGRLCLSGEIFDLDDDRWQTVLDGIAFYDKIKDIIKNGYTSYLYSNVKDYSKPTGYQAVLREYKDKALLLVHTFANGANPPYEALLADYETKDCFGSALDGDFRGKAFLLRKKQS